MSPVTPERQAIMDKVLKVLALADGTNHGPEAELARNRAAELMAKHNIALADLEATKEPQFEIYRHETGRASASCKHDDVLYNCIATLSGCYMVRYEGHYKIAGRPADIEAFHYFVEAVLAQRDRAWAAYYPTQPRAVYSKATHRAQWKLGFAYGVSTKVRAIMQAAEQKAQEWGLVPISPTDQARDWFKAQFTVRDGQSRSSQYLRQGYTAGSNVSLNQGVGQNSGRLAITH